MSSQIPPASTTQSRFHRRLRLIASLLAVLFAVGSLTIAGGAHLENATQVAEFVVCDDPAQQWLPAIDNSVIVWSDTRNGTDDIYGYDLGTRSGLAICIAGGVQSEPDVSGDTVVWQDRRNPATGPDIYGYAISSRTEFAICTESHGQASPAIYGNYVVWQDSRAGSNNQDIYGYNLNTHTEFPICTAEKSQVGAAISGNIVVWIDYRHEPNPLGCWPDCNTDIYGYDFSTATEFEICTEGHGQWYPAIDGGTVVWIDKRNGNSDVYAYDLATRREYPVCTEVHEQIGVSIDEQWIVWTDLRNGNNDLYGFQRSNRAETPLVTESHPQFQQDIDGSRLVWTDLRNEVSPGSCSPHCNYDIYGATIQSMRTYLPVLTKGN